MDLVPSGTSKFYQRIKVYVSPSQICEIDFWEVRISRLTLFHVTIGYNMYAERISCVKIPVYLDVDILHLICGCFFFIQNCKSLTLHDKVLFFHHLF